MIVTLVGTDTIRPLIIGIRYRHPKPLIRREADRLPYGSSLSRL